MQAEIGCIDNSWHLAKAYDAKEYHLVPNCTCDCSRHEQFEDRGQCSKCKHFRDPRPYIFITHNKETLDTACNAAVYYKRKKQVSWRTH